MTALLAGLACPRDSGLQICYPPPMPFPDPFRSHRKLLHGLTALDWLHAQKRGRRRRRRKDLDDGGILVEPNKPKNLSGGAAAALEFDDEAQS